MSYDVINDSVAVILDAKWKPADWSAVADEFARRLKKMPASGDDLGIAITSGTGSATGC